MLTLKEPIKFIWDKANENKNWLKHKVSNTEAEEVFFDENHIIAKDKFHSINENRYIMLGKTKQKRALFIVFVLVLRKEKVRVVSARDLNKKEYKYLKK